MSGIGHLGIGFAAKKVMPKVPLVVLLLLPMLLDILWVVFQALSLNAMAWTHSLVMSFSWSVLAGAVAWPVTRSAKKGLIISLLVFSHWVIDLITHPMGAIFPGDTGIPLLIQGPLAGAGLYETIAGVVIGEALLTIPGIIVYVFTVKKLRKEKRNHAANESIHGS